jgi:glucosyl-dolichyl phosphate glucuronosyltransferase
MSVDISVLISTRNRLSSLKRQFTAFEELDANGLTFEIFVIDNGSTDGTYEWLKERSSRLPVTALLEPRPGKNIALNQALPQAKGSLILFTDDDTLPVAGWLRDYVEGSERWPDRNIFCGPIEPLFPPGAPEALRSTSFKYPSAAYVILLPDEGEGPVDWLPMGPNFAVRSRTLRSYRFCESIGPTDDPKYTMGSETELLLRLRARGERSVYLPRAKVSHIIRDEQISLRWLKKRAFRFGRFQVRLIERDTSSKRLFGAPRYLWKQFAITSVRTGLHQVLNMPQRWESAFAQKMIEGQIYEYRKTGTAHHRPDAKTDIREAAGPSTADHNRSARIANGLSSVGHEDYRDAEVG